MMNPCGENGKVIVHPDWVDSIGLYTGLEKQGVS